MMIDLNAQINLWSGNMAEHDGWRIVEQEGPEGPKGKSLADAVFEDEPVLLVKNSRINKYGIFRADAIEVAAECGIDATCDGNRVFRVSQGLLELETDGNSRLSRFKPETFKHDHTRVDTATCRIENRENDGTIRKVDLDSEEGFTLLAQAAYHLDGVQELGIRQVGIGENNKSDLSVFPEGTKLVEVLPQVCFDFDAEMSEEEPAPSP